MKGKGKIVPAQGTKAYEECRFSFTILNFASTWK